MPVDERLRQQLAAWVEFYRELGIEDFYRRPPGVGEVRQPAPSNPREARSQIEKPARHTEVAAAPAITKPKPEKTAQSVPPAHATPAVIGGLHARSLNLFEAPPSPARGKPESLEEIRADLGDCQRCRLAAGRKTIVFGQGNPHAELVFVGEGPGADEDEQGLPFVGRAGQLLNRLIQFIGMKREDVYIGNVVKCRPPGNRTPERDEIETCSPFLFRQIEAIRPRLVCCLGAPAVHTLLGLKEGITKIRGQFFDYGSAKALATFHPAYILRNPREEKILREDFEKIRKFLATRP